MPVNVTKDVELEGTLYNLLYRTTFNSRGRKIFSPLLRDTLKAASRFVFDEGMSAFMGDIGWAAYRAKPTQKLVTLDAVRRTARLPCKVMWLEWNERVLAARAKLLYSSNLDPELVPLRSGWLMMQHPTIETAFYALSFGWSRHSVGDQITESEVPALAACPFAIMWNTEGDYLPWKPLPYVAEVYRDLGSPISAGLAGIQGYDGPVSLTDASKYLPYAKSWLTRERFSNLFAEQVGMMRYIWGALATLDDIPFTRKEVRTSKGFMGAGQIRKYLDHISISLSVPTDRYKVLARKAIMGMKKRAHDVRGHWREHWRHPLREGCPHVWQSLSDEKNALECKMCLGRKTWIAQHERGDRSLGVVSHDYNVTKK